MKVEIHKHLRMRVLVLWGTAWNVLLGGAIWVNGSLGRVHAPAAKALMAAALLGSGLFALAILQSARVRNWALRSQSRISDIQRELRLLAVCAGLAGAGTLVSLWWESSLPQG